MACSEWVDFAGFALIAGPIMFVWVLIGWKATRP
jgi:hypothetical protein